MNKNSYGMDDRCHFSSFIDIVDNRSYHFLSASMEMDVVPHQANGGINSDIYDNNLNEWNNSLNPISKYYKLPFTTMFLNEPRGFDQCTNPITKDIILCYTNDSDVVTSNPYYIFCKIFYNNNDPYWTEPFIISDTNLTTNAKAAISIICFNDSYLISWLSIYQAIFAFESVRDALIDLNGNIIKKDIILHWIEQWIGGFAIIGFKSVKSKFNDFNHNITNCLFTYLVIDIYYNNEYIFYNIGEYSNIKDSNPLNLSKPKRLNVSYNNSYQQSGCKMFQPISINLISNKQNNCCYFIPYSVWPMITSGYEDLYFNIIDNSGHQILGNILIDSTTTGSTSSAFNTYAQNQLIELFMLNNGSKYFMSLYSLQNWTSMNQWTKGKVYSIDANYTLHSLNKMVFVKNITIPVTGTSPVCGNVLENDNQNTIVLTWSGGDAYDQLIYAQSWIVSQN